MSTLRHLKLMLREDSYLEKTFTLLSKFECVEFLIERKGEGAITGWQHPHLFVLQKDSK